MTTFWRQNGLIIAGIALPLLVALGALVAKEVERSRIPPPQHAVLFTVGSTYGPYTLVMKQGRPVLAYTVPEGPRRRQDQPRLFLFDPKVAETREIPLPIPEEDPEEDAQWPVEGLDSLQLSRRMESPDGYTFSTEYARGNIVSEMFGGGRGYRFARLIKEGRTDPVPIPDLGQDRYWRDITFVAWVAGEEK